MKKQHFLLLSILNTLLFSYAPSFANNNHYRNILKEKNIVTDVELDVICSDGTSSYIAIDEDGYFIIDTNLYENEILKFDGLFVDEEFTIKVIDKDGNILTNVENYTDNDGKWINENCHTLYVLLSCDHIEACELDETFTGGALNDNYYYLSNNITLETTLEFNNNIYICLNGYSINVDIELTNPFIINGNYQITFINNHTNHSYITANHSILNEGYFIFNNLYVNLNGQYIGNSNLEFYNCYCNCIIQDLEDYTVIFHSGAAIGNNYSVPDNKIIYQENTIIDGIVYQYSIVDAINITYWFDELFNTVKVPINKNIQVSYPYSKMGYAIDGWSLNPGQTKYYSDKEQVSFDKDTHLYACFVACDDTPFTIKYRYENINGSFKEETEIQYGTTDTLTNVIPSEKSEYILPSVVQQKIKADGTTVVEVKYLRKTFSIIFQYTCVENESETTKNDAQTCRYGETPIFKGTTPSKLKTDDEIYSFCGWSETIVPATANKTYVAQFSSTKREYRVEFYDINDNLIWSNILHHGDSPIFEGPTPTKPNKDIHGYVFIGWLFQNAAEGEKTFYSKDEPLPQITNKNLSFIAQFDERLIYLENDYNINLPGYVESTANFAQPIPESYKYRLWKTESSDINVDYDGYYLDSYQGSLYENGTEINLSIGMTINLKVRKEYNYFRTLYVYYKDKGSAEIKCTVAKYNDGYITFDINNISDFFIVGIDNKLASDQNLGIIILSCVIALELLFIAFIYFRRRPNKFIKIKNIFKRKENTMNSITPLYFIFLLKLIDKTPIIIVLIIIVTILAIIIAYMHYYFQKEETKILTNLYFEVVKQPIINNNITRIEIRHFVRENFNNIQSRHKPVPGSLSPFSPDYYYKIKKNGNKECFLYIYKVSKDHTLIIFKIKKKRVLVDLLKKHPNIYPSSIPASLKQHWYYILIDETFNDLEDIRELIDMISKQI